MKNYTYYLIGIILPGIFNFLAIPLFKRALGDVAYGDYNLYFTMVLMVNTIAVGWIAHSIIRLASASTDLSELIKNSILLGLVVSCFSSLLLIFFISIFTGDFLTSIFFGLLQIVTALQMVLNAIAQARLKAKHIMFAEFTRSAFGLLIGYLLISVTGPSFSSLKLFSGLIVSHLISCVILFKSLELSISGILDYDLNKVKKTLMELMNYGIFLTLWFFCSYAIMYNDRYIISYTLGKEIAGNYSALFDMISRSITILTLPLLMSTYPILSRNFDEKSLDKVKTLLNRLFLVELIALPIALFSYWLFGYDILVNLLKLPKQQDLYFWPGFFILAGSIAGQIGMIAHKRLELRKETHRMFSIIFGVMLVFVSINFFIIKTTGIFGASIIYFFAMASYASIVFLRTKN